MSLRRPSRLINRAKASEHYLTVSGHSGPQQEGSLLPRYYAKQEFTLGIYLKNCNASFSRSHNFYNRFIWQYLRIKISKFRVVKSHDPSAIHNVSADATEAVVFPTITICRSEIVAKDVCSGRQPARSSGPLQLYAGQGAAVRSCCSRNNLRQRSFGVLERKCRWQDDVAN